jgi:hypothetical protein
VEALVSSPRTEAGYDPGAPPRRGGDRYGNPSRKRSTESRFRSWFGASEEQGLGGSGVASKSEEESIRIFEGKPLQEWLFILVAQGGGQPPVSRVWDSLRVNLKVSHSPRRPGRLRGEGFPGRATHHVLKASAARKSRPQRGGPDSRQPSHANPIDGHHINGKPQGSRTHLLG